MEKSVDFGSRVSEPKPVGVRPYRTCHPRFWPGNPKRAKVQRKYAERMRDREIWRVNQWRAEYLAEHGHAYRSPNAARNWREWYQRNRQRILRASHMKTVLAERVDPDAPVYDGGVGRIRDGDWL